MMLDVFNQDMFSVISLTASINKLPYKPQRIGELGLFEAAGISTTVATIEERDGVIAVLESRPRGGTQVLQGSGRPKARTVQVPHFPIDDRITPSDIQNKRRFGTEDQEETAVDVVNDKLQAARRSHEVTHEYLRAGAIQGIVKDGDAARTELANYFTLFGITEPTVDFTLGTTTTKMRTKAIEVVRLIEGSLGADTYSHVHALCGRDWFSRFIDHDDVRYLYERYLDGQNNRVDARKGFELFGITWEEYRGKIGGQEFIPPNVARFFPVGTSGVFKMHYAPGDLMEAVNTLGEPIYAKQWEEEGGRAIKIHTESNPLPVVARPACLVKGYSSN